MIMANYINEKLFSEFPPVATSEWEEEINRDLKGGDYEKLLVWKTTEGIKVSPYFRAEHLEGLDFTQTMPADFPYVRGNNTSSNDWDIRQDIKVERIGEANEKAREILNKGVTALGFISKDEVINSQAIFDKLLSGIHLEAIKLHFVSGNASADFVSMLANHITSKGYDPEKILGTDDFDPLGYLTTHGHFYYNSEPRAFERAAQIVSLAKKQLPKFKVLAVNAQSFHNAGASIVQELAFALSIGAEYLTRITDLHLTVDDVAQRMHFIFATGSNYFMEIAKFRAARMLWANIVDAYKPTSESSCRMTVHAITSDWNKTIYDPYVNMLRTTTESMSAVIGGVDSLTVQPFDSTYKKSDTISERIARNTQIVLKEEAYFDKTIDPSAGSYYIENLTNAIAKEAWKLFQQIDEQGGYLQAFKNEFIQSEIEKTAQQRDLNIATRREDLLGTNQYPNSNEKMNAKIDISVLNLDNRKTEKEAGMIGRPIKLYRGAMAFEELRLRTEKAKKTPKVFLLTYGNQTWRKARAMFSNSFFACAGFEVIDNAGFASIEEGVKTAENAKADLVVICSSDEEYATIVPQIYEALNGKAITVVAGYPKDCIEALQNKGIKHFIHLKSNILETLQQFQKELGLR